MDKGCDWKGTISTLDEHVATCSHVNSPSRKSEKCYIFLDDSNLWVTGQKALGKKLLDADIDSRFRVDLGKFLHLVTKGGVMSKAFLYGSVPPAIDTVWNAAREKKFKVNVFRRSESGKTKEVHGAMARDMMNTLHYESKENATYVVVTGDRDLKPIIEEVLSNGILVELWSWEDAMAREFRQLANRHHLFTANCLDKVEKSFSFTAYMSNRQKNEIDPAHAIVYREVPADEGFKFMLADHMHRLLRLFYITSVKSPKEKKDYIIEFPKSKPDAILTELYKMNAFPYKPCSYPEYIRNEKQIPQPTLITNRFEAFDSDYESDLDRISDSGDIASAWGSTNADYITHNSEDSTWDTEVRRNPGKIVHAKKIKNTQCKWGDHCKKASQCPYQHTPEENQLFARLSHCRFQYFKTKECFNKALHVTAEQRKWCLYAHDSQDSWCLNCRMYGHLTDNCQVKK